MSGRNARTVPDPGKCMFFYCPNNVFSFWIFILRAHQKCPDILLLSRLMLPNSNFVQRIHQTQNVKNELVGRDARRRSFLHTAILYKKKYLANI